MKINKKNYKYILRIYSIVDDFLSDVIIQHENLADVIVSFCTVTEKVLKIKLHNISPVLVYENAKIKENDALITILKEKEISMETIKIRETLDRYKLMFENEFSDDEMQVLIDIYNIRNHFVHGYKSDDEVLSDNENIVRKMGTVWEKISVQAISIFGKDLIRANKPKKKYSEEELEKVLTEEVRKKIQLTGNKHDPLFNTISNSISGFGIQSIDYTDQPTTYFGSRLGTVDEKCPRCGHYSFSLDGPDSNVYSIVYNSGRAFSDLYKCKKCNLELTRKEYEMAKKIKQ